jgi:hypothetical protein
MPKTTGLGLLRGDREGDHQARRGRGGAAADAVSGVPFGRRVAGAGAPCTWVTSTSCSTAWVWPAVLASSSET